MAQVITRAVFDMATMALESVEGYDYDGPWAEAKGGGAPAAPDPVATANAQTTSNIATAEKNAELNRYDQYSPLGSQTWSKDANGKWSTTTTLDPRVQGQLDQELATSAQLNNATNAAAGRVNDTLSKPVDYANLPGVASSGAQLQAAAGLLRGANVGPAQQAAAGTSSAGQVGDWTKGLNGVGYGTSNLGALPQANQQTRQQVIDSLYQQQMSRLNPQFQQRRSDLESELANQGITQGSEAYNREIQNFDRAQNDATSQALNSAITAGGNAEAQQVQTQLGIRGQGANEAFTKAQLGQAGETTNANNQTQSSVANANAQTQANIASMNAANDMEKYRASLAQQNALNLPGLAGNLQGLQVNDRNRDLNEQLGQRQQVINELSALRSGSQVGVRQPQFNQQNAAVNVSDTPVAQSIYNSYNAASNNYNAQQQQQGQLYSSLGSLAGMGALAFFSDRRLKMNIKRVGDDRRGFGIYDYEYKTAPGQVCRGVMADEIEAIFPHLVKVEANGYKSVDYKGLFGG